MRRNAIQRSSQTVLVTGAGRGNGKAIALGFLNAGWQVVGVDRNFEWDEELSVYGPQVSLVKLDLRKLPSLSDKSLVKKLERRGPFTAIVNNAGITLPRDVAYSNRGWNDTLLLNLTVPFLIARAFCERWAALGAKGSIINITSLGSRMGFPGNPAYQCSKAGLAQLSRAMALDYGKNGIRFNNLCPGYIRTAMTEKSYSTPRLNRDRRSRTMLDRWGMPEDLVGACLFLASDQSAYVTGIDLPVDGGWLAKGL